MGRFIAPVAESFTRSVSLGPCECPGTPHADGDTAEVYRVLGWDDLVDIGSAPSDGAARRILTTRAIASWSLIELDRDGRPQPVPIVEATVRLLSPATLEAIAEAVNESYEKASSPVPNASSAESPRLPSEAGTSTPTTQTPAKPTS